MSLWREKPRLLLSWKSKIFLAVLKQMNKLELKFPNEMDWVVLVFLSICLDVS